MRLLHGEERQVFTLNKVVVYLHLFCYLTVFLSNLLSNWLHSKTLALGFLKLEIFDNALKKLEFELNYKKMRRVFYVSLCASSGVYAYVVITDLIIDGLESDLVNWFSIYIPLTMNFFTAFIISFTLFLLKERYKKLKEYLVLVLSGEVSCNVKHFTNWYLELTKISNSLLSTFSLQISSMFLLILVTTTSNAYMLMKIELNSTQYVVIVNSVLIHLTEMVVLIFTYYSTSVKVTPHLF